MLDEWTHVVSTQRRLEEIDGVEMEDLQIVFLIRSSVTTSKKENMVWLSQENGCVLVSRITSHQVIQRYLVLIKQL